jgi:hypothetical protein
MKRGTTKIRIVVQIAIFSLLILFPVSSQYDAFAQIPIPFDCPSIESSGENNPLADGPEGEWLFAPFSSHNTSFVPVALAEKFSYLYTQTLPQRPLGAVLRC